MPTIVDQIPGDFATLALWLADFENDNLETLDGGTIRVAEVTGLLSDNGILFEMNAGATGPNGYAVIRAAVGQEFDPASPSSGARMEIPDIGNSFFLRMPYVRVEHIGVICTYTGASNMSFGLVECAGSGDTADNAQIDSCHFLFTAGWSANHGGDYGVLNLGADNVIVRNCTVHYPDSFVGNVGYRPSISIRGDGTTVQNCSTYNSRYFGVHVNGSATNATVENCVCIGSRQTADFGFAGTVSTSRNNVSSDGSADDGGGTGHVLGDGTDYTYTGGTQIFTDPSNGDLTLATSSPAEDVGANLSGSFTEDAANNTHNWDSSGWEAGAYDSGAQPQPVDVLLTAASANDVLNALVDLPDVSGPGSMEVTATAGNYASPLATATLQNPAFDSPASPGLTATLQGTPQDPSTAGDDTPVEAQILDGASTWVLRFDTAGDDGSVSGGTIGTGDILNVDSYTLTFPTS